MKYKRLEEQPKTFAIIFRTGDKLMEGLRQFASDQEIRGASFKAIGALSSVRLGWFHWQTKKYETAVALEEQVELLSLIGDIAEKDGEPVVHAHAVIGKSDGTAHGGLLLESIIRPTCEVILAESPKHLQKEIDEEAGIAIIRL